MVDKPVLRGEDLRNHAFLALTVIVNHDLVDGGPAARFAHRLQQLVESATGLPDGGVKEQEIAVVTQGSLAGSSGSKQSVESTFDAE